MWVCACVCERMFACQTCPCRLAACLSVPVLTVCFVTAAGLEGVVSVKEQAGECLMCAGQRREGREASGTRLCRHRRIGPVFKYLSRGPVCQ